MPNDLSGALSSFRFKSREWSFVDLRINIPPSSLGSDAINPHTQYSNPLAFVGYGGYEAIGASFTLGEGNQMVCEAADYMVRQLDGVSVEDLIQSNVGFYDSLTNPLQLRWLSPNSGLPLMAAGLIVNTLLDGAAKVCGLPAWEYLARLPSDFLISLIGDRHLAARFRLALVKNVLEEGLVGLDDRCEKLKAVGLPVYFTTWIGHDSDLIAKQIQDQYTRRGIRLAKIKISKNHDQDIEKIAAISNNIPNDVSLSVDANQTLSFPEALHWMSSLSKIGVVWLEEPFAPDNVRLFADLCREKKRHGWTCEVVTGENCPNHYTAAALIESGIDRFQADPCRMLGLVDCIQVSSICRIAGCSLTPHAGGSSLDEQSPHIQLFNLARVATDTRPEVTLTENVGFCSQFFGVPTVVSNGFAKTPLSPGLLVGLAPDVRARVESYKDGTIWLEL